MATSPNRNRKGRYPTKQGGRPMGSKAVRNTRRKTQAKRTTKSKIPRPTKRMVRGGRLTPQPIRRMKRGGGASCVNINNAKSCISNGCSWQSVTNIPKGGYCMAKTRNTSLNPQRKMAKGGKLKSHRTLAKRMNRGGKVLKNKNNRMSVRSQSNPKGKSKR